MELRSHPQPWFSSLRRFLQSAFYDWTREMSRTRRLITLAGLWIQGIAIFFLWTRSWLWPVPWPAAQILDAGAWLLLLLGYCLLNGMLTSEFLRKTQLESDQIAARQIQRTLQPQTLDELPGYEVETFVRPFRAVGGDYFDVILLPGERTLFAVADVSGKGMPAALLAANIQALIRSLARVDPSPVSLARQINEHLCRYTPPDRFATALFILLHRGTGEITCVNAGHNAPLLSSPAGVTTLEATGLPLGLFPQAEYASRQAVIAPGAHLLLFTDGLTDSIPHDDPPKRLRDVLAAQPPPVMPHIIALVEPQLNEDDITVLLVSRTSTPIP